MSIASTSPQSSHPRHARRWLWFISIPLVLVTLSLASYFSYQTFFVHNFHVVVPGQVYRSSQPDPEHLRAWVRDYHIRTVLNLRGESPPIVQEEIETLHALGVNYVALDLRSYRLPSPEELQSLIRIIETAERPLLIHCKAGADRSGLASCIASMAVGNRSFEPSENQISILYGHFNPFSSSDITATTELYESWCRANRLHYAGWTQFRLWAFSSYKPST